MAARKRRRPRSAEPRRVQQVDTIAEQLKAIVEQQAQQAGGLTFEPDKGAGRKAAPAPEQPAAAEQQPEQPAQPILQPEDVRPFLELCGQLAAERLEVDPLEPRELDKLAETGAPVIEKVLVRVVGPQVGAFRPEVAFAGVVMAIALRRKDQFLEARARRRAANVPADVVPAEVARS